MPFFEPDATSIRLFLFFATVHFLPCDQNSPRHSEQSEESRPTRPRTLRGFGKARDSSLRSE